MSGALVEEQLKTVKFRGAEWNIEFQPSQRSIQLFNNAAQGIVQFAPYFSLTTENNQLLMGFGTGGNSHRGHLVFAENVQGKLSSTFHWPIVQVMAIFKLASTGNCKISIADIGALQITIDSGIGTYSNILPAKSQEKNMQDPEVVTEVAKVLYRATPVGQAMFTYDEA